ncbi:MAG TPA: tetratricopeptide repeat protein [Longimicrobium sp.]|nr:tetratricopeptide repeat protein [Longimicrobium sp.]
MPSTTRDQIQRLQAELARDPGSRVFVHLAEALRQRGDLAQANRVLDQGLERHPDYPSALVVRARVLADEGKERRAEAVWRDVLRLDPDNIVAMRALGDLAEAAGRRDEAVQFYREVVRLENLDPEEDGYSPPSGIDPLPEDFGADEPLAAPSAGAPDFGDYEAAGAPPPSPAGFGAEEPLAEPAPSPAEFGEYERTEAQAPPPADFGSEEPLATPAADPAEFGEYEVESTVQPASAELGDEDRDAAEPPEHGEPAIAEVMNDLIASNLPADPDAPAADDERASTAPAEPGDEVPEPAEVPEHGEPAIAEVMTDLVAANLPAETDADSTAGEGAREPVELDAPAEPAARAEASPTVEEAIDDLLAADPMPPAEGDITHLVTATVSGAPPERSPTGKPRGPRKPRVAEPTGEPGKAARSRKKTEPAPAAEPTPPPPVGDAPVAPPPMPEPPGDAAQPELPGTPPPARPRRGGGRGRTT